MKSLVKKTQVKITQVKIRSLALPLLLAGGLACSAPVLANPGIAVPVAVSQQQTANLAGAAAGGLELGLSQAVQDPAGTAVGGVSDSDDADRGMHQYIFKLVLWAAGGVSLLFLLGMWLLMMRGLRYYVSEAKPAAR